MKKTFSIVMVLILAIFLSGCNQKKGEPAKEEASGQKETTAKQESYSGGLEKMMALGIPLKCEWKRNESLFGASWIKGKNSYGEITNQGKTAKVIVKDDCMWNWQVGDPQGFKICFEPTGTEEDASGQDQGSFDASQMRPPTDIEYKCRPAIFTDDKFTPPNDVKFMTIEEMMGGGR